MHSDDPDDDQLPAAHDTHASIDAALSLRLAVPAGHDEHDDDPDDDQNPPRHTSGDDDPDAHSLPAGHDTLDALLFARLATLILPPGHASHVASLAAPIALLHRPAGHRRHTDADAAPTAPLQLPAGHDTQPSPAAANWPAGHATHSLWFVAARRVVVVPDRHRLQLAAPLALHDPRPHSTHVSLLDAPDAALAVPAGHAEHDDDRWPLQLPGPHGEQNTGGGWDADQ